ncbi:MAG: ankyrin repeat domain-containing protein [Gammaproteobacteria bacterium]
MTDWPDVRPSRAHHDTHRVRAGWPATPWRRHLLSCAILVHCLQPALAHARVDDEPEPAAALLSAIQALDHVALAAQADAVDGATLNSQLDNGDTVLHRAVAVCVLQRARPGDDAPRPDAAPCISMLDALRDHGADLEARNRQGATPVMLAIEAGLSQDPIDLTLARHLVQQGANVDAVDYTGGNAAHAWVRLHARQKTAHERSEQRPNTKRPGTAPPVDAARALDALVALGVDLNRADDAGWTALTHALHLDLDAAVIAALLARGVDARTRDRNGNGVLWVLTERQDRRIVPSSTPAATSDIARQLVAAGAELDTLNESGQCVLGRAVEFALRTEDQPKRAGRDDAERVAARVESAWALVRTFIALGADTRMRYWDPRHGWIPVAQIVAQRRELGLDAARPASRPPRWLSWFTRESSPPVLPAEQPVAAPATAAANPTAATSPGIDPPREPRSRSASSASAAPVVAARPEPPVCGRHRTDFPAEAVVHSINVDGGRKLGARIDDSGHQATQVDIAVNEPTAPVVLVLTSLEPTIWNIRLTRDTHLLHVFLLGYHRQVVAGAPPETDVSELIDGGHAGCRTYTLGAPADAIPSVPSRPAGSGGAKRSKASTFTFGAAAPESAWISDPRTAAEQYFATRAAGAGPLGVEAAVQRGLLRAATAADAEAWVALMLEKFGRGYFSTRPDGQPRVPAPPWQQSFVVLGDYELPPGLYGANARYFIVPRGIARPTGERGHSRIYDFNTAECLGPAGC